MKKPIVVLITGYIGSGKTIVADYLSKRYGIPVFCSDYEAKQLYNDPEILAHTNEIVGGGIISDDGTVNKVALANIIFNDANKKKQLEDFIHRLVRKRFNEWKDKQSSPIVFMESALALKRGRKEFDYVVLVDAPESVRLERAMKRDKASKDKISQRMKSQEFDLSLVDFIIDNEIDFHESADKCVEELCKLF
jgi:dephospho-CoA kinase